MRQVGLGHHGRCRGYGLAWVVGAFLVAGCDDEGRSLPVVVDGSVGAYVAGTVTAPGGTPIPDASVSVLNAIFRCERRGGPLGNEPLVRTSADGRFVLAVSLPLTPPGVHCLDLSVQPPTGAPLTVPGVETRFRDGAPLDTTWVSVEVPR